MALFRYNATTNKLVPITNEGSVGIPVGAVMAFAEGTTNENWLLCDGRDTTGTDDELQTHYPALYTYLGNSNVLPAQFDHSKLSDIETITLPTTASAAITMQYDGILSTTFTNTAGGGAFRFIIYVNGIAFTGGSGGSGNTGDTVTVPFKKGDKVYYFSDGQSAYTTYVWYYKQPLYIKATSAGIEVDKDLYATKGYIRDQNILSDWEDVTLSTSSSNPTIMPYDGFITIKDYYNTNTGYTAVYIDGVNIIQLNQYGAEGVGGTQPDGISFPVKKGQSVYLDVSPKIIAAYRYAAFYKLRDYTGR